jgi:hypothetical protein
MASAFLPPEVMIWHARHSLKPLRQVNASKQTRRSVYYERTPLAIRGVCLSRSLTGRYQRVSSRIRALPPSEFLADGWSQSRDKYGAQVLEFSSSTLCCGKLCSGSKRWMLCLYPLYLTVPVFRLWFDFLRPVPQSPLSPLMLCLNQSLSLLLA